MQLNLVFPLLLCITSFSLTAQVSVNTGGGSAASPSGSVSYSIGQPFYTIASGSGTSVMGVQQPVLVAIQGLDRWDMPFAKVYPNPAVWRIDLEVAEACLDGNHAYYLYSVDHRTIRSESIHSTITEISLQALAAGPYVIVIRKGNEILKSFNIIKIN